MQILRIIASMDPKGGGPSEGIRQVSQALLLRGHHTECLSLDDPAADWLADQPVQVHALGPGKGSYGYAPAMKQWLDANAARFDAIIVSGLWQYHGFAAHEVLTSLHIPYMVFTHGMLDPWFKRTYPLKHLKKMLYWPWGDYRLLRDAHAVLFTSEQERVLASQSFRLYRARERVVHYGTSMPPKDGEALREEFLQRHSALRGKRLLTFLSRIHPKKGCDLLVEAFATLAHRNPALHLVMAGPDQSGMVPALQERIGQLAMSDRVTWTGMLQGNQKWGALYASEAFVLPSHQENFGIAVAEALGCGVPVLISDQVNIWREIEADQAGLIAPDTLGGTTDMLQRWLALDDSARQDMARRASTTFRTRYTVDAMADSLLQAIDDMRRTHPREIAHG